MLLSEPTRSALQRMSVNLLESSSDGILDRADNIGGGRGSRVQRHVEEIGDFLGLSPNLFFRGGEHIHQTDFDLPEIERDFFIFTGHKCEDKPMIGGAGACGGETSTRG